MVALKAAVIFALELRFTVHVLVPVQLPPQPPNVYPLPAVSVRVTCVPCGKLAEHVAGQVIPAGLLATVPVPVGVIATLMPSPAVKVGVTLSAAAMVTVQELVPEQAPLQPPKK